MWKNIFSFLILYLERESWIEKGTGPGVGGREVGDDDKSSAQLSRLSESCLDEKVTQNSHVYVQWGI